MLSDKIAVMNQGRIEQIGSPTDVYERPRTRFVAQFVGRSNLLPVRAVGAKDGLWAPDPAPGPTGTLAMIRPENVRLHDEAIPARPDGYRGRVDEVHYLGGIRYYRITLDNGLTVEAAQSGSDEAAYRGRPGSRVVVEIPRTALHLVDR
jgi:ABC-type Fe3+/spermidine/putrescine transport system ATPase subunit